MKKHTFYTSFLATLMYIGLLVVYCNVTAQPWSQMGLDFNGEQANDFFGSSLSLSADGFILASGAYQNDAIDVDAGQLKVFSWDGVDWVQKGQTLYGEQLGDWFGWWTSLSDDGNILAVSGIQAGTGGDNPGYVKVYTWNGSRWVLVGQKIVGEADDDRFGTSLALSGDGNTLAVGAVQNNGNGLWSGQVRVFDWKNGRWVQKGEDIDGENPGDKCGNVVSLNANGNTIALGAHLNDGVGEEAGHVRVMDWDGTRWVQRGRDIDGNSPGDWLGWSVSLNSKGNALAVGVPFGGDKAGACEVYFWNGEQWMKKGATILGEAKEDAFGVSVSISDDGNILAVGGFYNDDNGLQSGHVGVFRWNGLGWERIGENLEGKAVWDLAGYPVSLSGNGNIIAFGERGNDDNGIDAGQVRVFMNEEVLAVEESAFSGALAVFPNPTFEEYTIEFGQIYPEVMLTLYNHLGKVLSVKYFEHINRINEQILGPSVVYFVKIEAKNGPMVTVKVVKK